MKNTRDLKNCAATLAAAMALVGCAAPAPQVPKEEANRLLREATARMLECGSKHVKTVDDGVSDASTIAVALSQACVVEYDEVTQTIGQTKTQNNAQRRMWVEERTRRGPRVDAFLGVVLKARAAARR